MDAFVKVALGLAAVALFIIIVPLLGTLFGAFTGWMVGMFWPATFAAFLAQFGLSAFAPWQIGALLGFIGGFVKSTLTNTKTE